uniref:Secreted protein n=2 Tax=Oryza TaxID=4527 RepID=Q33AW4_ORYSJ|nr:hypothetical protein LOC_Os10g07320 [Oryza sativa Japonica Group]
MSRRRSFLLAPSTLVLKSFLSAAIWLVKSPCHIFAPTIMRRDQYTILRQCCREVERRPRGSHVCR